MLKKILLTFVLLLSISIVQDASADNYLSVLDPQEPWWATDQGNIDEAVLTIRPKGIYMEMGLYLTFSAKSSYLQNHTQPLEIVLNFELPEDAIVNDSWLWVEEEIIKAKIIDRWSASEIYEGIVDRQQDPSILFKESDTQYQLRIYPMEGAGSRKVKLSYLVPTKWTKQDVSAVLPLNILQTSRITPSLEVRTWREGEWGNPRIAELPNTDFVVGSNEEWGNFLGATIDANDVWTSLNFVLDTPMKDGVYISRLGEEEENIYQLAFLPSSLLPERKADKIAFLLDYQDFESTTTKEEVINKLKTFMFKNLRPYDQFNLFFSHATIQQASNEWLPADSESIDLAFDILENSLADYSNLPSLLAKGIEFVNNSGSDGSLFLVSNSDQVGSESIANQLIDDLSDMMPDNNIPINILDYQDLGLPYNTIGGVPYRGNEYFYINFSKITGGNYVNVRNNLPLNDNLVTLFQSATNSITSFDFHTTLANGFCHSRFTVGGASLYPSQPILQVGKFEGEFPFEIEIGGVLDSEVFFSRISIEETDVLEADNTLNTIWSGNYLSELEDQSASNNIIQEIITKSINDRALSLYTAMICLEPSLGGEVCLECIDESGGSETGGGGNGDGPVVDIDEETLDDLFTLEAFPNPFRDHVKIAIELGEDVDVSQLQFGVYNYLGQLVKTLDPLSTSTDQKLEFEWDATDQNGQILPKGIYFFMVQTPTSTKSLKLMNY